MKRITITLVIAILATAIVGSSITSEDSEVVNEDSKPEVTSVATILTENVEEIATEVPVDSSEEIKEDEIVISKDNIIPILKAITLSFTHKKDPTYKEILKAGGKTLFKLAEKKIGKDKHMFGLLNILKKYVEELDVEEMSSEEEEVVAKLAEEYLRKHKFRLLFPESLLLHQPEMEMFVSKMRELGQLDSRQFSFDFAPYLKRFSDLTANVRTQLQRIPLFNNMNLDRIGSAFSSLGTTFDEYIPALRNGAGIADLGISMGSMTALAAAGALISAPFFLRSFSASSREDTEEPDYANRRVSTGGLPGEQFLTNPGFGQPGVVQRPSWMDQHEAQQQRVYSPRVNPRYSEPSFALHNNPEQPDPAAAKDDEAYNKYLNEYNLWLQQYHNALSVQQQPNKEYEEYYRKYREWYSQYYNEQFGEYPPEAQPSAPNAYEENNFIPNMDPPPPPGKERETEYNVFEPNQANRRDQQEEEIRGDQAFPQNSQGPPSETESSNFQVIHVEEKPSRRQPVIRQPEPEPLPQPSPHVGTPGRAPVGFNHPVNPAYISPRPVYQHAQGFGPATESGFRPLGSQDHSILYTKKKPTYEEKSYQVPPKPLKEVEVDDTKFNPFSSIKSVSVFSPPAVQHLKKEHTLKENPVLQTSPAPLPPSTTSEIVPAPVFQHTKKKPESTTTPIPYISRVTSKIFRSSPEPTPRAETTPRSIYRKPFGQSVRVVTSTSVVTSAPVVQSQAEPLEAPKPTIKNEFKKRKITLTELLQNRGSQSQEVATKKENQKNENKIERRQDTNIVDFQPKVSVPPRRIKEEKKQVLKASSLDDDLPVYALDPFYGPRLSRTDAIFHQLSLTDEDCREQVVCNMYKNPKAYTPLSDFLSRQLTVTYDQLKRPTINDERILRFFKYLQAARSGQDGFNCLERYPKCATDTTRLSYKPIVNAYKKVSVLMNASGSS